MAPTIRDGDDLGGGLLRLPSALADEFVVVSELGASGAEADLLIVADRVTERRSVVKVYRRGIALDPAMIERIQGGLPEHVVGIESWGQSDDRWYEVLEYVETGSLLDLMQAEGPILDEGLLEAIVAELASALAHLHHLDVVHRDIKPANILVRTREPLDLVLADFGLAAVTEHSMIFLSGSRTAAYAAPEAAFGAVSPARDFWSLGMIILEALLGNHPFAQLSEAVIGMQLSSGPVDVSGVEDDRWRLLCRGLLTSKAELRWGVPELEEWLDGGTPDVVDVEFSAAPSSRVAYKIGTSTAHTQEELAVALAENWGEARDRIGHEELYPWFVEHWPDQNLVAEVRKLLKPEGVTKNDSASNPDVKLFRLLRVLSPSMAPVFRTARLTGPGLAVLGSAGAAGDATAVKNIKDIRALGILDQLGEGTPADAGAVLQRWESMIDSFGTAEQRAVRGGAPALEEKVRDGAIATLLNVAATPAMAERIREQAVAAVTGEALERPWFSDLGAVSPSEAPVHLLQILWAPEAQRQTEQARREAEAARQDRISGDVARWRARRSRLGLLSAYGLWLGPTIGGLLALGPALVYGEIRNQVIDPDSAISGFPQLVNGPAEVGGWIALGIGLGLLAGLVVAISPRYLNRESEPREWRAITLDIFIGTVVANALVFAVRAALDRSLPAEVFSLTSGHRSDRNSSDDFWIKTANDIYEFYSRNQGPVVVCSIILSLTAAALFAGYLCSSGPASFMRWSAFTVAVLVLAPFTLVVITYLGLVALALIGVALGIAFLLWLFVLWADS